MKRSSASLKCCAVLGMLAFGLTAGASAQDLGTIRAESHHGVRIAAPLIPAPAQTSCVPAPSGLVGWWQGEGNGHDSVSGNNATVPGGVTFVPAKVGQGFSFNNSNVDVKIPASSSLNVGSGAGFTLEAWISPANVSQRHPLFEWNVGDGTTYWGVHFYIDPVSFAAGPGALYANIVDNNGSWHQLHTGAGVVTTNGFQHVALTYDKASGLATIYCNGLVIIQQYLGSFTPLTTYDLHLGDRPLTQGETYVFAGLLDEAAVYNRALSTAEIQSIYSAGSAGKCSPITPPACVPAPSGLVSWWQAESNANDSVGANNGTLLNGTGFTSGEVGQAFNFNGPGQCVEIPFASSLTASNYSVEAWINPVTQVPDGQDWIFGQNHGVAQLLVRTGTTGVRVAFQFGTSASTFYDVTSTTEIPIGQLSHVVGTWDGTTLRLYINGVLNNQNAPGVKPVASGCPFYIGGVYRPAAGSCFGIGQFFTGFIDEVSYYNRALSNTEIQSIYSAGSAGKCPITPPVCVPAPSGLVSWWQAESNANDSVGGNNGVLLNGTGFAAGEVGQAFRLNGGMDGSARPCVQIPYSPSLIASNYSIETWIKPLGRVTNAPQNQSWIYGQGRGRQLVVHPGTTGVNVAFYFSSDHGNTWYGVFSTNEIPLNQFTHVAGTWDGAKLRLYINGVLNNSSTPGATPADSGCEFFIGGTYHPTADGCETVGQFFNGLIDEVSYYRRALSGSEIQSIYSAGSAGKCPTVTPPACVPPPSGLVSWWPGEGNASDLAGANNGQLQNVAFAGGRVGQAFVFNGSSSLVRVPASPALNVGLGAGLTIEVWVKPANLNLQELCEWNQNNGVPFGAAQIGAHMEINEAPGDGSFWGNLIDTSANAHALHSANGVITTNSFQHLAMTYDKASGVAVLYRNGVVVATANLGVFTPQTSFDFILGDRPSGFFTGIYFQGQMDEPAVYSRALSAAEIQAIYNAGSAGKCAVSPPGPVVPAITGFTPASGTNGTVITISGNNFNPTAASNIVYFGAVRATVLSVTPTGLVVTVPAGATYAPVTVTVNGLTACSGVPFLPTFNGTGAGGPQLAPRLDLPTSDGPGFTACADFNGDGKPDLLAASYSGISVFQNISSNGLLTASSFAPAVDVPVPTGVDAMIVADVDGDGQLDVVLLNRLLNRAMILKNTFSSGMITTNSFAAPVAFSTGADPRGVAVRDLDGDGKPELIVGNWGDSTVSILRNVGQPGTINSNSFAPAVNFATGANPQGLAVADLDGDGLPDIVTANNNYDYGADAFVSLLRNTSSAGNISLAPHVDLAGLASSYGLVIGDLDGDGKPDLAVSSFDAGQAVSVYRNTSTPGDLNTGSFAPHVDFDAGGWGNALAIGDLDGDGRPDLAVVTQLPDHLSVFKNISTPGSFTTGSLAPRVDYPAGWNPNGVVIGDLDGDGRPDIAFAVSYGTTLSIYQNQSPFSGVPIITSQPTDQTTVQGSNVVLSVVVTGGGPFSYQWTFNGTNISGATNDTLNLANLHPNQSGTYAVTVTSPYGTATSSGAIVTVIAQNLLIYKYVGIEKVTTAGQAFAFAYSGQMFFIPDATNGTFVGWGTIKGKKQYWVNALSDYLWITIPGPANRTYTILGQAGQEIDTNGYPHIWSNLHKGQNTRLTIGTQKYFSFPDNLFCNATRVRPDAQTGNPILSESTSGYTFAPQITQTANNTGQNLADLVNTLTQSLESQGYQKQ